MTWRAPLRLKGISLLHLDPTPSRFLSRAQSQGSWVSVLAWSLAGWMILRMSQNLLGFWCPHSLNSELDEGVLPAPFLAPKKMPSHLASLQSNSVAVPSHLVLFPFAGIAKKWLSEGNVMDAQALRNLYQVSPNLKVTENCFANRAPCQQRLLRTQQSPQRRSIDLW